MAPVITGPKLGSKRRGAIFPFLRSLLLTMNERRSPLTEKRDPSIWRFSCGNEARFRMRRYGEPKVPALIMRRLHVMVVRRGGGQTQPYIPCRPEELQFSLHITFQLSRDEAADELPR